MWKCRHPQLKLSWNTETCQQDVQLSAGHLRCVVWDFLKRLNHVINCSFGGCTAGQQQPDLQVRFSFETERFVSKVVLLHALQVNNNQICRCALHLPVHWSQMVSRHKLDGFVLTAGDTGTCIAGQQQPDLQVRFAPASALVPDGVETYAMFGRLKEEGKKWPTGFSFQLVAIRPQSRNGYVQLRTTDPWDAPDLSIGYFTDTLGKDIATLR